MRPSVADDTNGRPTARLRARTIARFVALLSLTALPALASCDGASGTTGSSGTTPPTGGDPRTPPPPPRDTTPPRLLGLGVRIEAFDSATGRAGDFDLTLPLGIGPLGLFGRTVFDPQGAPKALHEFDFLVPEGTIVRAPLDGVIAWVQRQAESDDYELLIRTSMGATWGTSIDHITNLRVDSGAVVRAGDALGTVRTFRTGRPGDPPIGFFELMVVNEAAGTAHCPLSLAHPAKADSLRRAVSSLLEAWRSLGHDTPDATGMVLPGCLTLSGSAM